MWELPWLRACVRAKRMLSLRHSITVTDYHVDVMEVSTSQEMGGRWVARSRLASLPLTGLARKILQRAELL
jgi:A/G-specific adenine glycosylase